MIRILPLLALCAACSSPPAENAAGENMSAPAPRTYATQANAPTPDYRALLAEPALAPGAAGERKAIAPLPPDARAIGEAWIARLHARGALLGSGRAGKDADAAVNLIDVGLTEAEFDRWARGEGWDVPRHIDWRFSPALALPPVSETAAGAIRFWPASTARTGMQHMALFHGRVELRDGCFFVGLFGQPADKLAWFHAEVGLDVDADGYFILRDRAGGRTVARLGEDMNWAGPASAVIDEEKKRALQQACGPAEVHVVGSPEASERFLTQYPHLRTPQAPPPPPKSR